MAIKLSALFSLLVSSVVVHGYFLIGANVLTVQRIDPLISPGAQAGHTHRVVGGSKFGVDSLTSAELRDSECTSIRIKEDKSAYWVPNLYFEKADGGVESVSGGFVIYYLFGENDDVTAFPDDFRMISGTSSLRSYEDNAAQQAVTFLCLDFDGVTTGPFNELPSGKCASGVRSQINFPSCWDGENVTSDDHKSHVSFPSGGPDSGSCPSSHPKQLPRIFVEVYWDTASFDFSTAANPDQPFVFANGDSTGYGYHADFINGWEEGVLQKVVEECNCNIYGDPQCCADKGLFTLQDQYDCGITDTWDEVVEGSLSALPGNNPITGEGEDQPALPAECVSPRLEPVYEFSGKSTDQQGEVVDPGTCAAKEAKRMLTFKHKRAAAH